MANPLICLLLSKTIWLVPISFSKVILNRGNLYGSPFSPVVVDIFMNAFETER